MLTANWHLIMIDSLLIECCVRKVVCDTLNSGLPDGVAM